jgi:hypothetical protein
MRSNYNVKCSSFFSTKVSFFIIITKHTDAFVPSWQEFKIPLRKNRAVAFATAHAQPFSLHHYCGFGNLLSVVSEAATDGSPMGQDQVYGLMHLTD